LFSNVRFSQFFIALSTPNVIEHASLLHADKKRATIPINVTVSASKKERVREREKESDVDI